MGLRSIIAKALFGWMTLEKPVSSTNGSFQEGDAIDVS
jgi:hypothetical protein